MKNKTNIVLIPTQGFCNRLRAISSAHILAKFLNTKCFIIWEKEIGCNCELENILLTKFETINISEVKKLNYFFNPNIHTNDVLINKSICFNLDYLVIQGGHEFKHPDQSITSFLNEKHKFYKSLEFSNYINDRIESIVDKKLNNRDFIGVHFRDFITNHDTADAYDFTKVSTPEAFMEIFNLLIKTQPKTKIYLSTNSDRIIKIVKNNIKNFENHIIMVDDNNKSRESNEGILDAVVDLLILSKSKYIIGTVSSSFSDEACFFNKISKLCIGNENINNYHSFGFDTILGYKMLLPDFNILCDIYKEEDNKHG